MVKIDNIFGDVKTGVQDNAIYQKHYGRQIRRSGYKENKTPSPRQLKQRQLFKDAVEWVRGLSGSEKRSIKEYYKKSYSSWTPGQPSTWYNYAKNFFLLRPRFVLDVALSTKYSLFHPAILKVEEIDGDGNVIYLADNLTVLELDVFSDKFSHRANSGCAMVRVTTLPGLVFEYTLKAFEEITITFPC
jgi:hypothetical protein